MTDLSHRPIHEAQPDAAAGFGLARALSWPLLPYVCVVAAGSTGLVIGRTMGGDAGAFEDRLLLLLRFMAGLKFLGVVAAAAAIHWRLTQPLAPRMAGAYIGALASMGVASGLIWSLGGIALGALLFHVGVLAFLYIAWKDDGARLPSRR